MIETNVGGSSATNGTSTQSPRVTRASFIVDRCPVTSVRRSSTATRTPAVAARPSMMTRPNTADTAMALSRAVAASSTKEVGTQ